MRWNINLASQPYEDARRFALLWGSGLLLFALLTAGLIFVAVHTWRDANQTRGQIASEQAKLNQLQAQQERDLAILNRPENRDVREKSQFLNTLIRRKQFSWTQVFASLEHLMPGRLQVISITPELTDDDQILVHLVVAGDARDKSIQLVRNLEKSSTFRLAQVHSETTLESRGGVPGGVQFEITALYVPEAERSQAQVSKGENPQASPSVQQARRNE
jgi:Tfp pilus assembly protein PilN